MRARREAAKLSLRAIARRAHVDAGHPSRIESGSRRPTLAVAEAVDQVLDADGALVSVARRSSPLSWWRGRSRRRTRPRIVALRLQQHHEGTLAGLADYLDLGLPLKTSYRPELPVVQAQSRSGPAPRADVRTTRGLLG
ncbi:helix-turn-helix domain-containing protein [Dactylosporangium sucinum]|uniref:HTH cro/C1-type domain-containing protein n=1 Tax=Dactylosporangium sucinum TaxID=1424081 RepID=A0A917UGN7_9ACTN|nr:hypothetical protein GCM10007977_109110 [Dactylosporangium sucinum]